jgi:chromosome segregation ATPase
MAKYAQTGLENTATMAQKSDEYFYAEKFGNSETQKYSQAERDSINEQNKICSDLSQKYNEIYNDLKSGKDVSNKIDDLQTLKHDLSESQLNTSYNSINMQIEMNELKYNSQFSDDKEFKNQLKSFEKNIDESRKMYGNSDDPISKYSSLGTLSNSLEVSSRLSSCHSVDEAKKILEQANDNLQKKSK